MRTTAVLGLVLAIGTAVPALAQPFVGDWVATGHPPGGADISEALSVTKTSDGYAVNAKLIGAPADTPQAGPGTDVVLNGANFSYKRSLATPDGPFSLVYTGVVSGDTFTGTVDVAGAEIPYTGVRKGAAN